MKNGNPKSSPLEESSKSLSVIFLILGRRHPAEKESKQATGEAKVGEAMKPTELGKLAQQVLAQNVQVYRSSEKANAGATVLTI